MKVVIAGIGTEVGKTVVSAIVCEAIKANYWKPVQAGDLDNSDSKKVKGWISDSLTVFPEQYRLNFPMSPHAAADIDKVAIDLNQLSVPESEELVIELAGGLMVPLTKDTLYIDWLEKIKLPTILVSSYYLGSINHTLLSWEALKVRNIPVKGIIFNGEKTQSTFDVIMHRTGAKCLLEIEKEKEINKEVIGKYAGQLAV